MKKILVVTIALLATLTGCGGKTTTSNSNNQMQEIVEPKQVKLITLEDIYGTWTFSKVTIDGSTYTIKEIEAMGDDSLSGVFFVFKEGGSVYMYAGEDDEGNFTYVYNEESNIITIGAKDFVIEDNELVVTTDNGIIYMEKYSNSQDITDVPKKTNEEDVADDIQDEEPIEVNNNGIRSEVKEAIDSYETFIDEYCAFMQKYAESGGKDLSMLTDYANFISKLADMETKMDNLEGDLTDAEALYYSEVMLRCSQKMLKTTIN